MAKDLPHIHMSRLWEYSRHPNSATLQKSESDHLMDCEECAGVLWACRDADSLNQVKAKLKKHGLAAY
jgi:hypothetical protein